MESFNFTTIALGILIILLIMVLIRSITLKEWGDVILAGIFIIALGICELVVISKIKNVQPEPTALDVYRGLTELEITSVNGVPKDTVVVFKNK